MEMEVPLEERLSSRKTKGYLTEKILTAVLSSSALFVGLIFPLFMAFILLLNSRDAIHRFGFVGFITNSTWDPVTENFGALTMIVGTIISTFLAVLLAIPVSIGIALFLSELAPNWLRPIISSAVELLAAIPSIIYGMWGFFLLAPLMAQYVEPWLQEKLGDIPLIGQLFSGATTGIDVLTTVLVLSLMIIPFMSSVIRDGLDMVPSIIKESAYSLGATRWEVIRKVAIPYSAPAITAGLILATGRALGETMAVTFIAGNTPQIPKSLFDSFTTITVALANQFTEADTQTYLSSLYYLSTMLFFVSFATLVLAKLLVLKLERRRG